MNIENKMSKSPDHSHDIPGTRDHAERALRPRVNSRRDVTAKVAGIALSTAFSFLAAREAIRTAARSTQVSTSSRVAEQRDAFTIAVDNAHPLLAEATRLLQQESRSHHPQVVVDPLLLDISLTPVGGEEQFSPNMLTIENIVNAINELDVEDASMLAKVLNRRDASYGLLLSKRRIRTEAKHKIIHLLLDALNILNQVLPFDDSTQRQIRDPREQAIFARQTFLYNTYRLMRESWFKGQRSV